MSGKEKSLIRQAKNMRMPIPDRIKNKPILKSDLIIYFNAFFDLVSDRRENGFIPWSSVIQYSIYYEFDSIQTEKLLFFIRALDAEHKKWIDKTEKGVQSHDNTPKSSH